MTIGGYPGPYTAHVDRFGRENLPPPERWPHLIFELPELRYPERLNCATSLIDDAIAEGHGDRTAIYSQAGDWSYAQLLQRSNQIANVLLRDQGVVPGNRVLLRGANSPMLIAGWLAVMKIGAIAVTTMPMLRCKELVQIATKANIDFALCDAGLIDELSAAGSATGLLSRRLTWGDGMLEGAMRRHNVEFSNVDTASDDICLLAFTSGTTGQPKATMHFHRDVLAMADIVGRHLLDTGHEDVCLGSPPLGFTFGLGALLVFPLRYRAATVMIEQPSPQRLLEAAQRYGATCLFTAPTMYRALIKQVGGTRFPCLERCVSAGERLPKATSDEWYSSTGIRLIDGLGATEMMHIFISARGNAIRPGATGKPLPGYRALVLDDDGRPLPPGQVGRLAVKGPTGCRYLADDRQLDYVREGWNLTGDQYLMDPDGYFWFQGRADDMIVSAGYNIAGTEVESALLAHPAVREVAVVGASDKERGQIVKAYVVPDVAFPLNLALVRELQEFVKARIAPYKYPRAIEFVDELPKTASGKIQRFALRQSE
jgi:2-aminobenzoate-CoA ligase